MRCVSFIALHCSLPMCRRQLALTSKDGDQKLARIQRLEDDAESLRREMKDNEGTTSVYTTLFVKY